MLENLSKNWFNILKPEFDKEYFKNLESFLSDEHQKGFIIYPPENKIFDALNITSFNDLKVVILGQDPYHGKGQAQGLSFSVQKGNKLPPSLKNIYKELENDIPEFQTPKNGDLSNWSKQGVLLLNSILTVRAGSPGSHQKKGWENFTDNLIQLISDKKEKVVFILWGNYAQQKIKLIDVTKHTVISSVHPSPFSAHNGFFGSKPFSNTNNVLIQNGLSPINWKIEEEEVPNLFSNF